ncbi:hypothetical protein [Paraburkholderia rhizosphaerae]|uniref:Uncharacterized protein n=1 Tax=Paraburkholderia rhizosphaerae TaxID=480658 RepID=A0A4R8LJ61_9BURK|nr:hypothetical protein [Paraburkholderia rhizosphaerae]TDY43800.1 hypothetical protein BX592_1171 [Paraburkholderia rhizosphaerae]
MKRAIRVVILFTATLFIGRHIANIYLEWPTPMPGWLRYLTKLCLRTAGLSDVGNNDDAEVVATLIVACISWTLTGLLLWLLMAAFRRLKNGRKT